MKQLHAWKNNSSRKPLILKGVRQTGKTYVLEQFGKGLFKKNHIINFEKQEQACKLFEENLDPKRIINDLQFVLNSSIDIAKDLLILDEIQACPRALTSLKYFYEELPELAICSAGSLLGLHLNETSSFPVGKVDMMHMYPMTFCEFLLGIGDVLAYETVVNINKLTKISNVAHQHLWNRLKQYFITGGLPEVVSIFSELQDNLYIAFQKVRIKQEELIKGYYADIAKHAGKVNAMHIDRTWRAVPTQLSRMQDKSTKRFVFKNIIPGVNRYKQLINVIDWLEKTELIIKIPIVSTARIPLLSFAKENIFKLAMFDIGILGAMSGLDPKNILNYDYGTYKGYFAENFVIQQLIASNCKYIANWNDARSEIEFLIQHEDTIVPVEVKSGNTTKNQSLKKYIHKYNPLTSFVLSANNLKINDNCHIIYLPLYTAEQINIFLK